VVKRVLQIIAAGYPGGGTNHVLQICSGLKADFEFGLVTQAGSYLLREGQRAGVEAVGLEFFTSRCDPRIPLRLRGVIEGFDPDLVHVHGGRAGLFRALARTRHPTVYSIHGFHFVQKAAGVRGLAGLGERVAMRSADLVIFESEHDKALAHEHGLLPAGKACVVIHNGIPHREPGSPPPGCRGLVGFIGRLEEQKDPMLYLDVMERLPQLEGIMVGGGELEAQVAHQLRARGLAGRIRMVGTLPHQETLALLPTLGVVVMTSRWEGLPLLPLDAMSAGVPVVATRVGGLPEIIEDGTSGVLVDGRAPARMAEAVLRLTEQTEYRSSVVAAARRRVGSLFSEERMLMGIRKVYERVLQ
jgi:glycosyltransferase involved in cell wall biosynthesis